MSLFSRLFIHASLVCVLSSCIAVTRTQKVTSDHTKGVRYKLPQPYILATPKTDGTITYEAVSLPDDTQEYAIHSYAIGAHYKLDVDVPHGMLEKVMTSKDTTVVAKQLLSSGANVGSTYLEETAKRKAAEKAASEKAKTDIAAKELALALAEAELKAKPDDAAAKLAVTKAQIELDFARRQARSSGGANDVAGQSKHPGAQGPVLYKVIDKGAAGVKLVAVSFQGNGPQRTFPTSSKVAPPQAKPSVPVLSVSPTTLKLSEIGNSMEVDFKCNAPLESLTITSVRSAGGVAIPPGNIHVNRDSPDAFRVSISPAPAAATYTIGYTYKPDGIAAIAGEAFIILQ